MSQNDKPLAAVMMGSKSDWEVMKHAHETLDNFGIAHECRVLSAHRTPAETAEFVSTAESRGMEVIIAAAGGAAHLAGVVAAHTILPVLGVPMESASLKGMDSLLSTVQMPAGIPVGTLAIGKPGAINAALLAVAILARSRPELREKLVKFRKDQSAKVLAEKLPQARKGNMAARSVDDQFAALEALKNAPPDERTIAELRKGLSSKSNFVAAKAAGIVGAKNLAATLRDALVEAFGRFIAGNDKGCSAATAIAKALAAAEIEAETVYLPGSTHVQMEASWGPPVDVAVELRCESLAALVRMNSRRMWDPLVRGLADKQAAVRSTAARGLGATGQDAANYLLQYKILIGDPEVSVMGDCFAANCLLTRSIEAVKPFLHDDNEAICEAAALALGESRLPAAFAALKEELSHATGDWRSAILLAIAMTRQPGSVDCLLDVLTDSPLKAEDAMKALAMYRSDSGVRERIRAASEGSQSLQRLFDEHFGAA